MVEPQSLQHYHLSEGYWLKVTDRKGAAGVERRPSLNFDRLVSKARQE